MDSSDSDSVELPSLMGALGISTGDHAIWSVAPWLSRPDPIDIKLYHVFDSLSQTPYFEGEGISAALSAPTETEYNGLNAKSLSNHLNWNYRHPTPFISFWDDWAKAEKEVERRLKQPKVYFEEMRESISRGEVKVAVVSRNRLLESNRWAFNLAEFLQRPERKTLSAELQAMKIPISPKEWLAMYSVSEDAIIKILRFRDATRPGERHTGLSLRQRLRALRVQDRTECTGRSTGQIEAWTELRWRHVASHVVKKRFLYPDGSAKLPTSKTQQKKQLGGTMRRLNRELRISFRRNYSNLGDKLYQALLVMCSMSDPLWKTAVTKRMLKKFQDSVTYIYRKVFPRLENGSDGKDSHGRMEKLKNFSSWLSRYGVLWEVDGLGGDMDWVIREERLVVESIEKPIGL